ncbi:MAG: protein-glutamate O-methyltransferase CheR [Candidatus Calescibacterium sp.]|nr:protein-glutamate O-methyltransferase CheR [Candidatus Calescibacterium sp.]MCX7733466.1 protein-glutamate O-methyltransferase CheR [bacterium]MDW8087447.1 protein-glutamate O-methyltransferase CheR [Candidatus Calescibacterium sp.]
MEEKSFDFSESEIKEIRDLIWRFSGIYIEDQKTYLLSYKLKPRLKHLGVDPRTYIKLCKDHNQKEIDELLKIITIGETQFFRDKIQIDVFFDRILKKYLDESGKKNLNFLSAGCATGEEPYTLSIYMLEKLPHISYKVVGVDINENFIQKAKDGTYSMYSVRGIPPYLLPKYFDRIDENTWKIKDIVAKNVFFEKINLMDKIRMRMLGKFDVIFCKNVIIYFDERSRNQLAETFWSILNKGGYLVLGPAERISVITEIFEPIFEGNMFFYKRTDMMEV